MIQRQEPEPQPAPSAASMPPMEAETVAPAKPASATHLETPPDLMQEILALLNKLQRRDPFRQMAVAPYDGTWKVRTTIRWLLRTLRNYSETQWRESAVAAWALGQVPLTTEQQEEAARTLGALIEYRRDSIYHRSSDRFASGIVRCIMTGTALSAGVVFLVCVIALLMSLSSVGIAETLADIGGGIVGALVVTMIASLFLSLLLSPVVMPISFAIDATHANTVRAIASCTLGRLQSPFSVGALARAAMDRNGRVARAAVLALNAVLPTLTPEHYGKLSSETVPNLCRALAFSGPVPKSVGNGAQLRLRLLDALDKVGDGRAIASLQAFIAQTTNQSVRERAEQVLAVLTERHKREQDSRLLLRGATGPDVPAEQLLRAASGEETTPPDELLRPHSADAPRSFG